MKSVFVKYFLLFALLCLPAALYGQAKVYTKTMRLADFPQKTTKIVLSGKPALDELLKEEITSRWRISPYEFCTLDEYRSQIFSKLYYFLHFASDADFTYMLLTKGGPAEGNPLQTFMDVVSVPVASAGNPQPDELVFLPAFIDMVQEYLLAAMMSDKVAYRDIRGIIHSGYRAKRGKYISTDREEGRQLFIEGRKDTIVPILIYPSPKGTGKRYYKLQVSTDNHLLYEFRRKRL